MNILHQLGLNPKKTIIYTTLINQGPSDVQNLVKATKLKRPTLYLYLEELKQAGLVHVELVKNKKLYAPAKPKKLLLLLKQQKQEFIKKEKSLLRLIPKLEAALKKDSPSGNVKIYQGKNALWDLTDELFKSHHDFLFIYSGKSLLQHTSVQEILKRFTKKRRQHHSSKLYSITDRNPVSLRAYREGDTLFREIRFTQNELNLDSLLCLCGPKICLVSLDQDPEGIIINNQLMAQLLKFMFWGMWKNLK